MKEIIAQFTEQIPILIPKIFAGIFVLLFFCLIGFITEKFTISIGQKAHLQKDIVNLLGRITRIALFLIGLVSALETIGVNVSALVASLGLTGFALGFALKDVLSIVLAGALILIYRPFQCGNVIKACGFEGVVSEIDLRYTTLKSEGKKI